MTSRFSIQLDPKDQTESGSTVLVTFFKVHRSNISILSLLLCKCNQNWDKVDGLHPLKKERDSSLAENTRISIPSFLYR